MKKQEGYECLHRMTQEGNLKLTECSKRRKIYSSEQDFLCWEFCRIFVEVCFRINFLKLRFYQGFTCDKARRTKWIIFLSVASEQASRLQLFFSDIPGSHISWAVLYDEDFQDFEMQILFWNWEFIRVERKLKMRSHKKHFKELVKWIKGDEMFFQFSFSRPLQSYQVRESTTNKPKPLSDEFSNENDGDYSNNNVNGYTNNR